MTTKEKVIRESIRRVERKIKKLNGIIYASPCSEILKIRHEAQLLIKAAGNEMSKEDWAKFDSLAEQEQMQLNIAKKQKNTDKMISRVVELDMELSDLRSKLYYIERSLNKGIPYENPERKTR